MTFLLLLAALIVVLAVLEDDRKTRMADKEFQKRINQGSDQ